MRAFSLLSSRVLSPLAFLVLAGCYSHPAPRTATPEEVAKYYPQLAAAQAAGEITISKAEPPPGCTPIGSARGFGWTMDSVYESLREKAAEQGANYVVLDGVAGGLFGRTFRCPPPSQVIVVQQSQPALLAPPPAPSCEPACSPGYACVRGSCVSACNPACAAGQQCGADRVCHAAR
jgi:hypothetical protein